MKQFWIWFGVPALIFAGCTGNSAKVEQPVEKMAFQFDSVSYPQTAKVDSVDTYFDQKLPDSYRWLEDDYTNDKVQAWIAAQNQTTQGVLGQIPFREKIASRYEELFNYTKVSSPRKVGEHFFIYRNDGLQNQSVIYYKKGDEGEEKVFIDPNILSEDGTVSIGLLGNSHDHKYMAYSRQDAGSDWQKIYVRDIESNTDLDDELEWVKFSGASWYKDGFFYSRYPAPKEGSEYKQVNENHQIFYHKLGTPQSEDVLVYKADDPKIYNYGGVTEDEAYFVIYSSTGTDGYETRYMKLIDGSWGNPVVLFDGFDHKNAVIDHIDGKFLVKTDIDAPRYRLIAVDVANPAKENWTDIIPQKEHLLEGVNTAGGKLFADYLENACTKIYQMEYDGSSIKEIVLPGLGSAGGFHGDKEDTKLYYTYTSFTYPTSIFEYDVASGESKVYYQPELPFDHTAYESKQVFFKSKDGTDVPMFIVHKKGLELDGQRPTMVYGYGGFNISLTPSFSTSNIILLENGGVYCMVNLRGGGEFGENWHQAGMLMKKQNVFDDFISASEYVIKKGYTNSEKLAIAGGSNGGLLVGACMAQRPDLFAVAFPAVGVMDMLRFHKFTVGWGWVPEYGSSEQSVEMFEYLKGYSPYHNLKEGTNYPATMVTTADHDDRVHPAHSFKFAARLQECHAGTIPVIIRIEVDAGHGAGKPTSKIIEEQADKWAFMFANMNIEPAY